MHLTQRTDPYKSRNLNQDKYRLPLGSYGSAAQVSRIEGGSRPRLDVLEYLKANPPVFGRCTCDSADILDRGAVIVTALNPVSYLASHIKSKQLLVSSFHLTNAHTSSCITTVLPPPLRLVWREIEIFFFRKKRFLSTRGSKRHKRRHESRASHWAQSSVAAQHAAC